MSNAAKTIYRFYTGRPFGQLTGRYMPWSAGMTVAQHRAVTRAEVRLYGWATR